MPCEVDVRGGLLSENERIIFSQYEPRKDYPLLELKKENEELKELKVVEDVTRIISIGYNCAIAYSYDKNEIYKISFEGNKEQIIWRTIPNYELSDCCMELYNDVMKREVEVFVYCEKNTIILIDEKDGETKREFTDRLNSDYYGRNIVYVENKRLLVTISQEQIQFTPFP